jgi:hypothetical protein
VLNHFARQMDILNGLAMVAQLQKWREVNDLQPPSPEKPYPTTSSDLVYNLHHNRILAEGTQNNAVRMTSTCSSCIGRQI